MPYQHFLNIFNILNIFYNNNIYEYFKSSLIDLVYAVLKLKCKLHKNIVEKQFKQIFYLK